MSLRISLLSLARLGLVALLAAGLLACPADDTNQTPAGKVTISGGVKGADQPQGEGADQVGVTVGALASSGLAIVALDTQGNTAVAPLAADGTFTLEVTANTSYTLNLLDTVRNVYIASFLYRSGASVELALSVGLEDVALGQCQVMNGEVWCDGAFFDPADDAMVELPEDMYGHVRMVVHPSAGTEELVEALLGGTTLDYEVAPNPLNKFHVAVTNVTEGGVCQPALIGVAEKIGDERYLYTDKTYANDTCQATVRFQAMCTMERSDRCVGFLRVDIVSSGTDCTAYPPMHVAEPVNIEMVEKDVFRCPLPATCTDHSECESGVCNTDVGFCAIVPATSALRFHVFDVGNGQSILTVTPSGKAILLDAGRPASGRMAAAMVRRIVPHLDMIILSHFDADHAGGAMPLILGPDGYPGFRGVDDDGNGVVDDESEIGFTGSDDLLPDLVLDRGLVPMPNGFDDYARVLETRRRDAIAGEEFDFGDGVTMTVLTANGRIAGAPGLVVDEENARSVGVIFRYGEFSLLDLGDLPGGGLSTEKMEQEVIPALVHDIPIDVHMFSHHGSKASSPAEFLKTIRPRVGIISVGDSDRCGAGFNSYGLPAQEVLDSINEVGTVQRIYQTEEGGASFRGECQVESNQLYPRDYGETPVSFSYSVFTIEAYPERFRVSGLTFDDSYDAAGCDGEACPVCPIGYVESPDIEGACVIDPCLPDPCSGRGRCDFVGPGAFTCACEGNFAGETCAVCADGYTGGECDTCAEGFLEDPAAAGVCVDDGCDPDPCSDHGTCSVTAGGLGACACDGHWVGAACDACDTGYAGDACADCAEGYVADPTAPAACIADPCASQPCGEHGTCVVLGAEAHRCDCEGHWGGEACTTCATGYAGEACDLCDTGYTADPMNDGVCIVDLCDAASCNGRGTCSMVSDGVSACACEGNFGGESCGGCAEGYAGATCEACAAGFHDEGGLCAPNQVVTACAVQTRETSAEPGEAAPIVGVVEVGTETAAEGRLPGIDVRVCAAPLGLTAPVALEALDCAPAEYVGDLGATDAYQGLASFPGAGLWDYVVAASGDGGQTWTVCDVDGIVTDSVNPGLGTAWNIANGGFEDQDGPATAWTTDIGVEAEAETEVVHSGFRAVRLTRASTVNGETDFGSNGAPVVAGQSYTVSMWFYDDDGSARANVIYAFFDESDNQLGASSYGGTYTSDMDVWQNITRDVTAPDGAVSIRVSTRIYTQSGGQPTGGSVVLDDVAVLPAP
ncbi:MAG: MBL fold metallo-hydrolase [Deltaproteobacteria bacterium]|nr:MAG: MBL fold metallo-hydrolase [Deltaproteobacteria bacterium]